MLSLYRASFPSSLGPSLHLSSGLSLFMQWCTLAPFALYERHLAVLTVIGYLYEWQRCPDIGLAVHCDCNLRPTFVQSGKWEQTPRESSSTFSLICALQFPFLVTRYWSKQEVKSYNAGYSPWPVTYDTSAKTSLNEWIQIRLVIQWSLHVLHIFTVL